MRNPKTQAWLYLGVGLVGVVAAGYFLYVDYGTAANAGGGFTIFDWVLLVLAGYGIYRGAKGLFDLAKGKPTGGSKD